MALTIYGSPMSRTFRVLWMAKELGLQYENVPLDPRTGDTRKPDYLKTVATWIKRLDDSDTSGVNLKVYRLHYGSAKQVAGLLNEILVGRGSSGLDSAQSQVAPGAGLSIASSGGPLSALSAQPPTAMAQAGAGGGAAVATARPSPLPAR